MSRGYGKIQWRLLAILAAHEHSPASRADRLGRGLDTPTLALRVHGREPTHSELVSIRRALAALMRAGGVGISHDLRAPALLGQAGRATFGLTHAYSGLIAIALRYLRNTDPGSLVRARCNGVNVARHRSISGRMPITTSSLARCVCFRSNLL